MKNRIMCSATVTSVYCIVFSLGNCVLFIKVSSFQDVLNIEVSSFQDVLNKGFQGTHFLDMSLVLSPAGAMAYCFMSW